MKKFLLGFALTLSMGAFAQNTIPVIPGPYPVIVYEAELYACDNNGTPITDPYNIQYTKYNVYLSYPVYPNERIEAPHITLQKNLCSTGMVQESNNVSILSIEYSKPRPLELK
ncbi:hypothetical protein [Myroides odoratus]|uniref:Uncharacterized protein n=1 Tax=Myroides odoratus TaxID=256 RepID=A0A9Q6ZDG9_MYROD|nr:hypothetical protein [Myroides odoratus]EHQ41944.1 hypothetical protein Myrod_1111 [Myroides odoratus DSM 2801]EKB09228.1 hypothetical protein HMPREF9716_00333 [Myroides odoratus CIP 103059]QQT99334.1 hypothetical protein I6I88_14150 [Myroides odoratus]WQD58465.1 hypothetical protein U0010_04810 [Myroides odoratus]STZ29207.1 Uncharacterised protein [Myroides odoratus]